MEHAADENDVPPKTSEDDNREVMAQIRQIYQEAPSFVDALGLHPSAPGTYTAIHHLVIAFLRASGAEPESKVGQQLYKAAGRAISNALLDLFGKELDHVSLSQRSCSYKNKQAYAVESEEYPAVPIKVDAGEAKSLRDKHKQRRLKDGDLAVRPPGERGNLDEQNTDSIPTEGGGSSRYLSELLSLSCGAELLKLRLYPDAKELTESFAAFHAVRTHLPSTFKPDDPTVTMVSVGDGSVPRTAALFAFRTKWQCFSVDPQMKHPSVQWEGIDRLQAMRCKIEDCHFEAEKLLLVCVHAHVGLPECMEIANWSRALGIVAIPCCNFYNRLQLTDPVQAPMAEYYDSGIVSPHRLVRVWALDKDVSDSTA